MDGGRSFYLSRHVGETEKLSTVEYIVSINDLKIPECKRANLTVGIC